MIKALAHCEDGSSLILIGLSEENIQRLKDDKPIDVDLTEIGGQGKLCIIYGKTERAMADRLIEGGVIGPTTIVHDFQEPL